MIGAPRTIGGVGFAADVLLCGAEAAIQMLLTRSMRALRGMTRCESISTVMIQAYFYDIAYIITVNRPIVRSREWEVHDTAPPPAAAPNGDEQTDGGA
jgi:hypothetical protein